MWTSWRRLQLAMAEAREHEDDDEDSDAWTVSEPEAEPEPDVPELEPQEVVDADGERTPLPHGHPSVANLDQVPWSCTSGRLPVTATVKTRHLRGPAERARSSTCRTPCRHRRQMRYRCPWRTTARCSGFEAEPMTTEAVT